MIANCPVIASKVDLTDVLSGESREVVSFILYRQE